jgi:GMP synthase (glutamine-hydrolysing)
MADLTRQFYGLQFHPEVTHTRQGQRILERFVTDICHCETMWRPLHIIDQLVETIKQAVGDKHVLLALSGGVDSSVAAALIHRAIGDQLICVFVDHGLLRRGEAEQVMAVFAKQQKIRVTCVDAREQFLSALQGIVDPEHKRKVVGQEFIRVFEEQARAFPEVEFLAQGTIYPDVIESAQTPQNKGVVIKSHHNVGGLPERMQLKLLEPLRELFKDEVRKIGLELGLPHDLVYRHPFPGPGLAVRILGEIIPEYVSILQHADAIFLEELHQSDWYHRVSQAFAVFLPVRSVGVKGDARHYEYVVSLRAVETTDFMTATWVHLPYELLAATSRRIMNEVPGIARVTYDISSKPPATIEWE